MPAGVMILAVCALAALVGPAAWAEGDPAQPKGPAHDVAPRATPPAQALITVSEPAGESRQALSKSRMRLRAVAEDAGTELDEELPEIGVASVELEPGQSVNELGAELAGSEQVVSVEANRRLELRRQPDDPAFAASDSLAPRGDAYQWFLRRQNFPRAWDRSRGGRARVAVIDTGAAAAHPDLAARIEDAFDKDDSPFHGPASEDENGHGTHVSGLACGHASNGYGLAGAGYRCKLLVYKSDLTLSSISESIVEAADRGADVISMSFGGDGESPSLERAIGYAFDQGVVMVAAAANESTTDQGVPARYLQPPGSGPRIKSGIGLVVTAAQYDGSAAWFGPGRGNAISLAAYGSASQELPGIFSTFPAELTELETAELCVTCRAEFRGDDRFAYLEGTSMATPQVAGAAALIRHKRPNMRAVRVVRLLKRHAKRNGGFSNDLGWGILNANKALRKALKTKRKR